MTPPALFLGLSALVFGGFGIAGLAVPDAIVESVGVALAPDAVLVELRAIYGGMMLGGALLAAYCMRPDRQRFGLVAVALVVGGTLAGRLLGLLWEPMPEGMAWVAIFEAVWVVFSLGLLPRTPRPA